MNLLPIFALAMSSIAANEMEIRVESPVPVDGCPRLVEASRLARVPEARQFFDVYGEGMTVAVIDSGIRYTHEDLRGRVVAKVDFSGDGNIVDAIGHGTHVSGIIAANGINVGVAPKARIVMLKVFDKDGRSKGSSIENALAWALEHKEEYGITCVNMSFGVSLNLSQDTPDFQISKAMGLLRGEGVACIVSAGNSYHMYQEQGMAYPASESGSISVGAVYDDDVGSRNYSSGAGAFSTGADRVMPFSQRLHESKSDTNMTDIFAPGGGMKSTGTANDTASAVMDGTSMSAPFVAGVVLLVQEYHLRKRGRLPTVDEVESILRMSAKTINDGDDEDDNVRNTMLDYPRVDALGALDMIDGSRVEPVVGATLRGNINFGKAHSYRKRPDRYQVDLKIQLSDGETLAGARVLLDVGGKTDVLSFDENIKLSPLSGVRARVRMSSGTADMRLSFSRQDLDDVWQRHGVADVDVDMVLAMPIGASLLGREHKGEVAFRYVAKKDKRGLLKPVKE